MTIITGAFSTYDSAGDIEDLANFIANVDPDETPVYSSVARMPVTNKLHIWQTDALTTAANNAQLEGDEIAATQPTATVEVVNSTQISYKAFGVSGTQEAIQKAGRKSEMAYQLIKHGKELKRDIETGIFENQGRTAGNESTARTSRGLPSWIATNVSQGSGASDGADTTARTDGTQRELTEALLKDVLKQCWDNGGAPDTITCGSFNKQKISNFGGNINRQVDAQEKTLPTAIDVYISDFGSLRIVPNHFMRTRDVMALQMDMLGLGKLRPMFVKDLAKTGDADRKFLGEEWTLIVKNEKAHGAVFDLTTS